MSNFDVFIVGIIVVPIIMLCISGIINFLEGKR